MSGEELAEFHELWENENFRDDYEEVHFIRASTDPKEWIQKWLSEDYGHNRTD
jgi:hypothetical protein